MALKIVMIGGGSYNWTPTLARDIILQEELADGGEIWLVDIDPDALAELETYCRVLFNRANSKFKLYATTDRDDALPGADFVVITISTGRLEAMRHDLEIPYKYGIYQPVGDTVGPGGISRSLRNVPVFESFVESIMRHCPQAWVLNVTNPMTVLTQTLIEGGCKTIGLCHELYALWGLLREYFDCKWEDVSLQVGGVNHFAFILKAHHGEFDCFKLFDEWAGDPTYQDLQAAVDLTHEETHGRHFFKFAYFRRTGRMLYPGDRHTTEFLHNVLTEPSGYGKSFNVRLTSIEDRYSWLQTSQKNVRERIQDPEKISLEPSREALASLIVALAGDKTVVDVVNVANTGQIENLPRNAVVETMATITNGQVRPHAVGRLPDDLACLVYPHCLRFNMTLEAARTGDRKLALAAMASDPMVKEWRTAKKLLEDLLEANRQYLPRFFK